MKKIIFITTAMIAYSILSMEKVDVVKKDLASVLQANYELREKYVWNKQGMLVEERKDKKTMVVWTYPVYRDEKNEDNFREFRPTSFAVVDKRFTILGLTVLSNRREQEKIIVFEGGESTVIDMKTQFIGYSGGAMYASFNDDTFLLRVPNFIDSYAIQVYQPKVEVGRKRKISRLEKNKKWVLRQTLPYKYAFLDTLYCDTKYGSMIGVLKNENEVDIATSKSEIEKCFAKKKA